MKLLTTIDHKNYDKDLKIVERTAVRGIIKKNNLYAFVSSKFGFHKFIGGGLKIGEDLSDTLAREVSEESGLKVIKSSIKPYGKVIEFKKGNYEDVIFNQTSYYFYCDVEDKIGDTNLDDYEAEYGFKLSWQPLNYVIKNNINIGIKEQAPWFYRDLFVMKSLIS